MAKIGLMLSGGMAKGAYQVGALKAIREYFEPNDFSCVSAASIGTLNAYAFVNDMLPMAEEMWTSISANIDYKWILKTMKSTYIEGIANKVATDNAINQHFFVPLFNFNSRTLKYQDLSEVDVKNMKDYLMASVAMPFYSSGVVIDGVTYFDGAMIDNIPAFPLVDQDLDYILCIYFDSYNYMFETKEFSKKIIKLTFSDKTIISNSVMLSEERTKFMLNAGYEKTKEIMADIFANGIHDLEFIQSKMNEYDVDNKNEHARITGDFMVRNINKAAQVITRRTKK